MSAKVIQFTIYMKGGTSYQYEGTFESLMRHIELNKDSVVSYVTPMDDLSDLG